MKVGLNPFFYGGNRWPQGVASNPVPVDPRNPNRIYPDFLGAPPVFGLWGE